MISKSGTWLIAAASAVGLVVAMLAYFGRGSGIDHTAGALLVTGSTALMLLAGLILALGRGPGWLRALLLAAILLDVLGTLLAAFFLHAWLLLAVMIVAGVGWLMSMTGGRNPGAAG